MERIQVEKIACDWELHRATQINAKRCNAKSQKLNHNILQVPIDNLAVEKYLTGGELQEVQYKIKR